VTVLWPWGGRAPGAIESWSTACAALVIPLTAIFHHLLDHHRCILETHGTDYNFQSVRDLFLHDPSLPWAIVAMVLVYHLGKHSPALRPVVVPAFAASIPLSIWLWDIPFSGRTICRHMHDGRIVLPGGIPLTTRVVYGLCFFLYLMLQSILFLKRRRKHLA
jgi:hypothetical protein